MARNKKAKSRDISIASPKVLLLSPPCHSLTCFGVFVCCWVGFDRKVIEGTAILAAVEKVETVNERPVNPVTITNCGISKFVF